MNWLDDLKKIGADALAEGIKSLGKGLDNLGENIAKEIQQSKEPPRHINVDVKEVKENSHGRS
jgi:hypothetical protein